MALLDIQVPDIGDFDEVTVIELMVKPGDNVKADQSLITVESDKASMEIPSSHAGVVQSITVKIGDKQVPIANGKLVGANLSFDVPMADGKVRKFEGNAYDLGKIGGKGWSGQRI